MTKLLLILSLLSTLVLAAPATAQDDPDPAEEEVEVVAPELLDSCDLGADVIRVTPDVPFDEEIVVPIGALNLAPAETVGRFAIDLAGLEVGTRANVRYELTMDSPSPLVDYDLIVNGVNELATDNPETVARSNQAHCSTATVEVVTYIGTPLDVLTLRVIATPR
jgi:hypothetical protein